MNVNITYMDFRIPKIREILKSFTKSFQQAKNLVLISEDFSYSTYTFKINR